MTATIRWTALRSIRKPIRVVERILARIGKGIGDVMGQPAMLQGSVAR